VVRAARLRRLYEKERKRPFRLPFRTCLRMWRRGFLSESAVIYGIGETGAGDYLSDAARFLRTPGIDGRYSLLLDDKELFEVVFSPRAPVPRILASISASGQVRRPGVEVKEGWLLELLGQRKALVLKPPGGGGGHGVLIVRDTAVGVDLNGTVLTHGVFRERAAALRGYIVTEFVEQARYAAEIFPATTNSIRVVTMIDPDESVPFVPIAVHRFGTRRSAPADNWTQGGLSALVGETGTLGPGAGYPARGALEWCERHPDTGSPIAGVRVPRWEEILSGITRLAGAFPQLPYVGWDVVVTETGYSVIEGNSNTDVNLLQVHMPLLRDGRVRRFYAAHGAL
jgi:hypothetical protein